MFADTKVVIFFQKTCIFGIFSYLCKICTIFNIS